MTTIKIEKIELGGTHSFRKFKDLTIPLSKRITLICGHNGVGKSTILGLLSSNSGLDNDTLKSYFGKSFDASIAEIIYIDHQNEVQQPKNNNVLFEPRIHFSIDGTIIVKECSFTRRGKSPRARVVSRTTKQHADGTWKLDTRRQTISGIDIGPDAKISLPTIYLGMIRMLPIGESPDRSIENTSIVTWHDDDIKFMVDFINDIMPNVNATNSKISTNKIKSTSKISTHPAYSYGSRSVSLGQDSLGAIVTAIASFKKLKRDLGNHYHGGLLIIDELDAGFHPHAIGSLISQLKKAADDLKLQIVATTHSTRLIEAVHPDSSFKNGKSNDDSVVYLKNTNQPKYSYHMELADILRDMNLTPIKGKLEIPRLKIYFEDDEAKQVFDKIINQEFLKTMEAKHNVKINPMPLGIGCSSLAKLPEKDAYFSSVVLVVDADGIPSKNRPDNLAVLPGEKDGNGAGLSPERTIIQFIKYLYKSTNDPIWEDVNLKRISTDYLHTNFLKNFEGDLNRNEAKKWWKEKSKMMNDLNLYELWISKNSTLITEFKNNFEKALQTAAKNQRTLHYNIARNTETQG